MYYNDEGMGKNNKGMGKNDKGMGKWNTGMDYGCGDGKGFRNSGSAVYAGGKSNWKGHGKARGKGHCKGYGSAYGKGYCKDKHDDGPRPGLRWRNP